MARVSEGAQKAEGRVSRAASILRWYTDSRYSREESAGYAQNQYVLPYTLSNAGRLNRQDLESQKRRDDILYPVIIHITTFGRIYIRICSKYDTGYIGRGSGRIAAARRIPSS